MSSSTVLCREYRTYVRTRGSGRNGRSLREVPPEIHRCRTACGQPVEGCPQARGEPVDRRRLGRLVGVVWACLRRNGSASAAAVSGSPAPPPRPRRPSPRSPPALRRSAIDRLAAAAALRPAASSASIAASSSSGGSSSPSGATTSFSSATTSGKTSNGHRVAADPLDRLHLELAAVDAELLLSPRAGRRRSSPSPSRRASRSGPR